MLERVPARHATIDDLQACKTVLAKLHSLEITYGSLSSDIFLILENGQALLHGFGDSFATDHKPLFEREMQSVEDVLRRGLPASGDGMSVELRAEISTIYERDDGIRPEAMRQAAEDGKITITAEEHRARFGNYGAIKSLSMQLLTKEPKLYIMYPNKELEA